MMDSKRTGNFDNDDNSIMSYWKLKQIMTEVKINLELSILVHNMTINDVDYIDEHDRMTQF